MSNSVSVSITPEELRCGEISAAHRESALRALDEDGVVVLENVIDVAHLDLLRERMLADLETILARPDAPYNFNTGNVQQDPPPFPPYIFRDILVNDMVIGVTRAALGGGVKSTYYSGNTALPGGQRQPVHPDVAQLWPNLERATPAFGFVVNVPVVDMNADNGATELWPGTHRDTTYNIQQGSARISEEHLAPWRERRPPYQPTVARGSVVIRDIRLWHAGTPNHSSQPRPMIAMIHWCGWFNSGDRIKLAREAEPLIAHPGLRTVADYIDGPIDYLMHNQAYDLQK